jgi:hypothetical protein
MFTEGRYVSKYEITSKKEDELKQKAVSDNVVMVIGASSCF